MHRHRYLLSSTFFRLHSPSPIPLSSTEEAQMFLEGKLPKTAEKATDMAVLALFPQASGTGKKITLQY